MESWGEVAWERLSLFQRKEMLETKFGELLSLCLGACWPCELRAGEDSVWAFVAGAHVSGELVEGWCAPS